LLKESQVEAEEVKLERDRERKLRKISTQQISDSQKSLVSNEQTKVEFSSHHSIPDGWAQLTTISEDNDIK